MPVQRRRFSEEFKLQVLQEVLSGERQASIARRHSVSANTILQWLKAYKAGRLGGEATSGPTVQELLVDQQIKAEIIQEQAQQIHLLKKAVSALKSPSASNSSGMSGKPSRSQKPAP